MKSSSDLVATENGRLALNGDANRLGSLGSGLIGHCADEGLEIGSNDVMEDNEKVDKSTSVNEKLLPNGNSNSSRKGKIKKMELFKLKSPKTKTDTFDMQILCWNFQYYRMDLEMAFSKSLLLECLRTDQQILLIYPT